MQRPRTSNSLIETWIAALTQPSVSTFDSIASDMNANAGTAVTWIAISGLIVTLLNAVAQIMVPVRLPPGAPPGIASISAGIWLCVIPFAIALDILGFLIACGISHVTAKALGGTATFGEMSYAVAAYSAPLSIVVGIIGAFFTLSGLSSSGTYIGSCINAIVGLYWIFLNITAIKAAHRFGWGSAIFAGVIIWVLIFIVLACLLVVALGSLGPNAGNIFSNVIRSL